MGAGSVKAACEAARAGGREVGVDYEGEYRVDWTSSLGQIAEAKAAGTPIENPIIHSTFGYAAQVVIMDPETGDMWINSTTRRLIVQTKTGPLSTPMESGASSTTMASQFALDFYVSFVLMLALAFGIAFETPIVVYFLVRSGIVPRATMARSRRYVLLGTVIAAAMLTPPDVISQLLLAGPMYLLFELGLFVARVAERKADAQSES